MTGGVSLEVAGEAPSKGRIRALPPSARSGHARREAREILKPPTLVVAAADGDRPRSRAVPGCARTSGTGWKRMEKDCQIGAVRISTALFHVTVGLSLKGVMYREPMTV